MYFLAGVYQVRGKAIWRPFHLEKRQVLKSRLCKNNQLHLEKVLSHIRWKHSDESPNPKPKTAPAAAAGGSMDLDRLANLTHFHEKNKQNGVHGKGEDPTHPDTLEARSMDQGGYRLPHPIWTHDEVSSVEINHYKAAGIVDMLAYGSVRTMRSCFDFFSGYTVGRMIGSLNEDHWTRRIIFLEAVAAVPGMVGAMVRHLKSLRRFERDQGWIHTLLEEAENERMHLMTAMRIGRPGFIMRTFVFLTQVVFVGVFSLAYMISPRFCHRFVGYFEEEAVKTYTHCLKDIDAGRLERWKRMKAPEIAAEYWKLPPDALMRDVILAIRADEAHHRLVNHTLSGMKPTQRNPFKPGA